MIETAPRKNANGDTLIRAYLIGKSRGSRPPTDARKTSMGSNALSFECKLA
jgi:hypothetical protein